MYAPVKSLVASRKCQDKADAKSSWATLVAYITCVVIQRRYTISARGLQLAVRATWWRLG